VAQVEVNRVASAGIGFGGMPTMVRRLAAAWNAHDARRVASLFAEGYRSAQPVHPSRGFGGSAQVLENWTAVFEGVPDFVAELVDVSITGTTEWGNGTGTAGMPMARRLPCAG
jgi:ketosteroid isomerase-like protein